MARPLRLAAPAALCLALTLVGCTDDPEPDFADPTPDPSSQTTAHTSEPTSPAPTTVVTTPEPEVLSPEETVRAWVKARNELLRTGDPAGVFELSTTDCSTCADLVEGIPEIYQAGGWIRTAGWRVSGASTKPDFASSKAVAAGLVFTAGEAKSSSDAPVEPFAEERNFLDFTLAKLDGRWLVEKIVFLQ